ncbi:MAG TPA: hypothetical protein VIM70_02945 [Clostridium sp.]|uniref:hypothetical protein n=1 Tax=Clostridium sp. TaxID=1506 RepID=UPI002F93C3AE
MANLDGKTERIMLRISLKNKEIIVKLAKEENRTLSNWCENAMLEKIKKSNK